MTLVDPSTVHANASCYAALTGCTATRHIIWAAFCLRGARSHCQHIHTDRATRIRSLAETGLELGASAAAAAAATAAAAAAAAAALDVCCDMYEKRRAETT